MKKYFKNEAKHIPMMLLICIIFYGIAVIAEGSSINSSEVSFDNTGTHINSGDVQGAIGEVFTTATDYTAIKTQIGNTALTTTAQTVTGAINEIYSMSAKDTLPNNADANDYWTANGSYLVDSSYTYTNLPLTSGVLTVTRPNMGGTYVTQTMISENEYYFRLHYSSTWTSWKKVANAGLREITVDTSTAEPATSTTAPLLNQDSTHKIFANDQTLFLWVTTLTINPASHTLPFLLGVLPAGDRPLRSVIRVFPLYYSNKYNGYAIVSFSANGNIHVQYMSGSGIIVMREAISKL